MTHSGLLPFAEGEDERWGCPAGRVAGSSEPSPLILSRAAGEEAGVARGCEE